MDLGQSPCLLSFPFRFLQRFQGPYIANKRTPRIQEQYRQIGGKSPIGEWTELQGKEMIKKLQALHPGQNFKHYVTFRYAPPLTEEVLLKMQADGVKRAIAFSQYPQYSCTTTGSSLNHLWRECIRLGLEDSFKWSVIDRWHNHPTFISAVARRVALGLQKFPEADRDKVTIVFSAHSIPMMIVNRGDPYTSEIAATVDLVMQKIRQGVKLTTTTATTAASSETSATPSTEVVAAPRNPHILAWQSKVGFLPWMGPPTSSVIEGLGKQGHKHVLVVPIAFTSDHVETLFEIDKEYAEEAHAVGITHFLRAPSLNEEPLLSQAQAELVSEHVASGKPAASSQYSLNCPGCTNPACRTILNPVAPYEKRRDSAYVVASAAAAAAAPTPAPSKEKDDKKKAELLDLRWPTTAIVEQLRAHRTKGPTP
jgi:protoporphyrin/coproporphyrin ferrochelatase